MKALAVVVALALGSLVAGPAQSGELTSALSGAGVQFGLPSPEGLYVLASGVVGAIQLQPANPPPKDVSLTINVNKDEGVATRAWYLSPVWMAIGGLGLVLGIILVIMAARGGGAATTVVRG